MSSNNKTSHLISTQVPEFVRDEHPQFVTFLEKYYESLEGKDKLLDIAKNIPNYLDVDQANEQYRDKMYDNFLKAVPRNSKADKNLMLKHIKDFYRAKGTEKSVKFIGRLMFNKESDFYFPKSDILRASDGKWQIDKSVKIIDIAVDNVITSNAQSNFQNHVIRGAISNAYATVESVDVYYDRGDLVTELKLSKTFRDFENGEKVFTYYTDEFGQTRSLTGYLFSGVIRNLILIQGGNNYVEGATVTIESNEAANANIKPAQIVISKTTKGSLKGIVVNHGGAGFKQTDSITIFGGGGSGAAFEIFQVDTSGTVHPNSYAFVANTIQVEANTPINNAVYSNLVSSVPDPANAAVGNLMYYWTYSNIGPIVSCNVNSTGNNYSTVPTLDVSSNTFIRTMGILGRLKINRGGTGYELGNRLNFVNQTGHYGCGASAIVSAIGANGEIEAVEWNPIPGHFVGGSGYEQSALPRVEISSANGNGANIVVTSIIGDGELLFTQPDRVGEITELRIVSRGSGYTVPPTINLAMMGTAAGGDGTAQASVQVATGAYTYPGRYINDDGHLSSYNFIQNKNYYQNYSYVVKIDESVNKYRKALRDLTHPLGMKLFGEYNVIDQTQATQLGHIELPGYAAPNTYVYRSGTYAANTVTISVANTENLIYSNGVYIQPESYSNHTVNVTISNVIVNVIGHGLSQNDSVYLQITSGDPEMSNDYYIVAGVANANTFFVQQANAINTYGNVIATVVS